MQISSSRVGALPDVLTSTAEWLAGRRYGLDWAAVDHLPADRLTVPALVFHSVTAAEAPSTCAAA